MADHGMLHQQLLPKRVGVGQLVPLRISSIFEHSFAGTETYDTSYESHNTKLVVASLLRRHISSKKYAFQQKWVWHPHNNAMSFSLPLTKTEYQGHHMMYNLSLKHCEIHIYYNDLSVSTVLVSIIFDSQFMRKWLLHGGISKIFNAVLLILYNFISLI